MFPLPALVMSQMMMLTLTSIVFSPLSLVLLLLVGYFLFVLRTRECKVSTTAHPAPPGPRGLPLLGNLLQLTKKPHRKLAEYRKQYGDVYQIMMGSRPAVILNGFDTVRRACVKQADDFAGELRSEAEFGPVVEKL